MNKLLLTLLVLAFNSAVVTAAENPIIYSREIITITPAPVIEEIKEADQKKEEKAEAPAHPRQPRRFTAYIRPASSLVNEGVFSQTVLTPNEAALYLYDEPIEQPEIDYARLFTPVDVLTVSPEGIILAILPNLNLSELSRPVKANGRVKALLHLRAGTTEVNGIRPGDQVEHSLFDKKPLVLE